MDITLPPSAKPQLLRASHEWCTANGYAPYLLVAVDGTVNIPKEYVKDGQIVLNTSYDATAALQFDDEMISFRARFGGVAREISVPVARVMGLFARETGQGVYFELGSTGAVEPKTLPKEVETPAKLNVVSSIKAVEPTVAPSKEDDPEPPKGGGSRPTLVRVK
jgi:stringent starvation protein B